MNHYAEVLSQLQKKPERWLITGVAGFIGSNLLEHLLKHNQYVIGLDNFSSGSVCMVLASNKYDENDYYREYADFMRERWSKD